MDAHLNVKLSWRIRAGEFGTKYREISECFQKLLFAIVCYGRVRLLVFVDQCCV
jgi:hypothetical protein